MLAHPLRIQPNQPLTNSLTSATLDTRPPTPLANPQLRHISALYFSLEGTAVVEFKNRLFPCDSLSAKGVSQLLSQLLVVNSGSSAARGVPPLAFAAAAGGSRGSGCSVDADALLSYFGFDRRTFWGSVGALVCYLGVLHLLCFAALLVLARRR